MTDLCKLANRFGTDKGPIKHLYTEVYHRYFKDLRSSPVRVLEIGIAHGSSILMWAEYFSKGDIHGMDCWVNNPEAKDNALKTLEDVRATVHIGSQDSLEDLEKVIEAVPGGFDVIIDDGSHCAEDQQFSLGTLFPHLLPGGLYFIEDLQTRRPPNKKFNTTCRETIEVLTDWKCTEKLCSPVLTESQNQDLTLGADKCVIHGVGGKVAAIQKRDTLTGGLYFIKDLQKLNEV